MTEPAPLDDTGPLSKVYTLAEAAEYMRLAPRTLAKVKRIGSCSQLGREILLSEGDILAVRDEMRVRPDTTWAGAQASQRLHELALVRRQARVEARRKVRASCRAHSIAAPWRLGIEERHKR